LGGAAETKDESKDATFNIVEASAVVESLAISFRKIGRIENLVGFDKLTKLCLDNNLIDSIINLSHLTNLRWLDLSFNKIKKIEGLEALRQLEDLTLFSNKISIVEGLEYCPLLRCLSLGNNRIDSLEQVIRLRQIKSLRMLTLSGNPVCKETEYKMIVLAYLDNLKYIDYTLIDANEKHTAKEQYHDELLDVEEKEAVVTEKEARDVALGEYLDKLDDAGIRFAYTTFDDMFYMDFDVERLKHMPGVKELVDQFRANFKAMSDDFTKVAMEKYDKKTKEKNDFERAIKQIRGNDDSDSAQLIESFLSSKKVITAQLTDPAANFTRSERQRMVKRLYEELNRVCCI
jgi:hypothetical protein